jgi:hypothetical protein
MAARLDHPDDSNDGVDTPPVVATTRRDAAVPVNCWQLQDDGAQHIAEVA